MTYKLPLAVQGFPIRISTSVDEILLPKYMNLSTNFRGLDIAPSCLKDMNSVLSEF